MLSSRKLVLLAMVLFPVIFWYIANSGSPRSEEMKEPPIIEEEGNTRQEVTKETAPEAVEPSTSEPPAISFLEDSFPKALNSLLSCLKSESRPDAYSQDASIENWLYILKAELGEQVFRAEAWTNIFLITPQGEQRRIRLEIEVSEDDLVVRKLKYTKLDEQGVVTSIDLPSAQTVEPNETFIASLELDGQVTLREKAERVYFQDGSEAFMVHRNNMVSEIELNRAGVSFRCWQLDQPTGDCECL